MRLLLVLPPGDLRGRRYRFVHHPIVTAYLAGAAQRAGADVRVVDAALEGLSVADLCDVASVFQPDCIGVVPFEYRRELPLEPTDTLTVALKASMPQVPVGLLNGVDDEHHVALRQRLRDGLVDFVVLGDSEIALAEIVRCGLSDGVPAGVWVRDNDGALRAGTKPEKTPLDSLAFPAWELFEHQRYRPSPHRYSALPLLPVLGSRVCPFQCDFCPQSLFNTHPSFTMRSAQSVLSEILHLKGTFGVREVEFYDPTFATNRDGAVALCEALIDHDVPVIWSCNSRCDLLDDALIELMVRAGCRRVLLGVESGDQAILDGARKQLTLPDIRRAFQALHRHGVETIASFIIGLPGESPQSARRTIDFALELDPTYASFFMARGSHFTLKSQRWLKAGRFEASWAVQGAGISGPIFIPHAFNDVRELKRWVSRAYRRFYGRPLYGLRRATELRSLTDLRRLLSGAAAGLGAITSRRS